MLRFTDRIATLTSSIQLDYVVPALLPIYLLTILKPNLTDSTYFDLRMPVSFDITGPPTLQWHPIPPGDATCKVHLIQAGGLSIPQDMALLPGPDTPTKPDENGKPNKFYAPDYVFLIEHASTGDQYLFDLGIRKDLKTSLLPSSRTCCQVLTASPSLPQTYYESTALQHSSRPTSRR